MGELERIQVQRSSTRNRSNDSVSNPNHEQNQDKAQNQVRVSAISGDVEQDELSTAKESANALMAETDPENSGYIGTKLNVFA
jgi:hypothetical protein